MNMSPGGPLSVQQFTSASADETLGPWVDVRGYANVKVYLTGVGTTSSGVVTIEEASPFDVSVKPNTPFGADTGKYSSVATVNASDVSGGIQKATALTPGAYCYVRARISTAIGGGGAVTACLIAY